MSYLLLMVSTLHSENLALRLLWFRMICQRQKLIPLLMVLLLRMMLPRQLLMTTDLLELAVAEDEVVELGEVNAAGSAALSAVVTVEDSVAEGGTGDGANGEVMANTEEEVVAGVVGVETETVGKIEFHHSLRSTNHPL